MKCPVCKKEHDGTFGASGYCSRSCCNKRSMTKEIKDKISKSLKAKYESKRKDKKVYNYICDKCGLEFISYKCIRKDRLKTCLSCKRIVPHVKDIKDITVFDISKRTLAKIFRRSGKGCVLCGWKESVCDRHHVIPKKNGGKDSHDNIIIVCPNHHRVLHSKEKIKFSIEYLLSLTIDKTFPDWKDYYNKNLGQ